MIKSPLWRALSVVPLAAFLLAAVPSAWAQELLVYTALEDDQIPGTWNPSRSSTRP